MSITNSNPSLPRSRFASPHARHLPKKWLLTFELQSFLIVLSTHRIEMTIQLLANWRCRPFSRKNEPSGWFPVASEVLATTDQVLVWFHKKKTESKIKVLRGKNWKVHFTEMGAFKLYNAWHKSWISKFTIEENSFWRERANVYNIASILHWSCHMHVNGDQIYLDR